MADRATIASTEEFRRIAENGRVRGYNQQPSDELLERLHPEGTHMITHHLPHEHIAGELVEPHVRTVWMCAVTNNGEQPVNHVLMDMSMSDFDSLTVLTKDGDTWVAAARPAFIEMNRQAPATRGPYGTNEGDIWLAPGSGVQIRLDEQGEGLQLVHEMLEKDGSLSGTRPSTPAASARRPSGWAGSTTARCSLSGCAGSPASARSPRATRRTTRTASSAGRTGATSGAEARRRRTA